MHWFGLSDGMEFILALFPPLIFPRASRSVGDWVEDGDGHGARDGFPWWLDHAPL